MRIMEETVKQQNKFTSCGSAIAAKEAKRYELKCAIAEFVNRGGKITEIAAPDYKPKPVDEISGELRDQFERGRANAHAK